MTILVRLSNKLGDEKKEYCACPTFAILVVSPVSFAQVSVIVAVTHLPALPEYTVILYYVL
jgi:hypothetical protein